MSLPSCLLGAGIFLFRSCYHQLTDVVMSYDGRKWMHTSETFLGTRVEGSRKRGAQAEQSERVNLDAFTLTKFMLHVLSVAVHELVANHQVEKRNVSI